MSVVYEDPYAPKPPVIRNPPPVFPLARLRRLGAPAEQLEAMGAAWDQWTVEQRREFTEQLSVMTDSELADVLHGGDQ